MFGNVMRENRESPCPPVRVVSGPAATRLVSPNQSATLKHFIFAGKAIVDLPTHLLVLLQRGRRHTGRNYYAHVTAKLDRLDRCRHDPLGLNLALDR
jgi:hypothetical protein